MHVSEHREVRPYELGVTGHTHIGFEVLAGFAMAVFNAETERHGNVGLQRLIPHPDHAAATWKRGNGVALWTLNQWRPCPSTVIAAERCAGCVCEVDLTHHRVRKARAVNDVSQ